MLRQRLRDLDRRVLREDVRRTPEQWRRQMARWWWVLGGAVLMVVADLALALRYDRHGGGPLLISCLVLAHQSGRMKAEHERITGRDAWARVRPLGD